MKMSLYECDKIIASKNPSRKKLIEALSEPLQDEYDGWYKLSKEGCNDPSWPDGTNMNLIRNHIINSRQKAEKMLTKEELENNPLFNRELPPEVDEDFVAVKPEKSRLTHLESFGHSLVYGLKEAIKPDDGWKAKLDALKLSRQSNNECLNEGQLSLF